MWPARLVHASKRALAGSFSLDEGQVVEEYFEPRHPAALTARAPWHSVAGLGTHTGEHKKSPIHTSPMGAYLMCPDDGRFHVEGRLAEARCRECKRHPWGVALPPVEKRRDVGGPGVREARAPGSCRTALYRRAVRRSRQPSVPFRVARDKPPPGAARRPSRYVRARTARGNEEEGTSMAEPSLYERLGGVFAIAAVVDHFSDAVVQNPIVGQRSKNPELREWHTDQLDRLPGLKFMRTLWVCNVAGGPLTFAATKPGSTPLGLEEAHRDLHITPEEFDEVAAELGRSLDHFGVPAREKDEVLAAFAAHKGEVTEGSMASA
jgi:hemoglobin